MIMPKNHIIWIKCIYFKDSWFFIPVYVCNLRMYCNNDYKSRRWCPVISEKLSAPLILCSEIKIQTWMNNVGLHYVDFFSTKRINFRLINLLDITQKFYLKFYCKPVSNVGEICSARTYRRAFSWKQGPNARIQSLKTSFLGLFSRKLGL
jgi:hypothetical protein